MDIKFVVDRCENGNYYIKSTEEELILSLLTDEFMEVVNKMFSANNDSNIKGNRQFIIKGNKFREDVLNKPEYYNVINSDLFIYIYQWFTNLPLHHLDEILEDKNGARRNKICSKNLAVIDECNIEYVTNRRGDAFYYYQKFRTWLKDYCNSGKMTFMDLINNNLLLKDEEMNMNYIIEEYEEEIRKENSIRL